MDLRSSASPMLLLILLVGATLRANAECENACYGHGHCTAYDMCMCDRNWQANDCSESKIKNMYSFIIRLLADATN
jgi:hypothetical protein